MFAFHVHSLLCQSSVHHQASYLAFLHAMPECKAVNEGCGFPSHTGKVRVQAGHIWFGSYAWHRQ
jgi:hypothetical protein